MKILVIGGGASGMIAAGIAAKQCAEKLQECGENDVGVAENAEVFLFEKNEKLGKKIFITGKGRCNLTNACETSDFLKVVYKNPKFLMSALASFSPFDTMNFFENLGLKLKIERGNRVFPVSDKASDVIKALEAFLKANFVKVRLNHEVLDVKPADSGFLVEYKTNGILKSEAFDKVILASGGKSYPATGSPGDGYKILQSLGHNVLPLSPALVPINLKGYDGEIEGLSLKNVTAKVMTGAAKESVKAYRVYKNVGDKKNEACGGKSIKADADFGGKTDVTANVKTDAKANVKADVKDEGRLEIKFDGNAKVETSEFGEMLFTRRGVSGPIVLSLSGQMQESAAGKVLSVDLKPALSLEQLDKRLLRDFEENKNKQFKNALGELLPKSLIPYVLKRFEAVISSEIQVNRISSRQREALAVFLKDMRFEIDGLDGFHAAVITSGGVDTKEVNPKTMESRIVPGLFVTGELLDVHAATGGYNLQIAFATGMQAGKAAGKIE